MSEKSILKPTVEFIHLHVHTEYSLMEGTIRIRQLVDRAVELGMPAVAITDRGVMRGAVDLYTCALKAGIKPIIGLELCVVAGDQEKDISGNMANNHLVLLASNEIGYRNLVRLSTAANFKTTATKPRVDKEFLRAHVDGLIALSGSRNGEITQKALQGDAAGAAAAAEEYSRMYGAGNFYLELLATEHPEQEGANRALIELSRKTGIPLVAANECHYLQPEDATAHRVLLAIRDGQTISEPNDALRNAPQLHFRSPEEMARYFADVPEALRATVEIAERCNVELKLDEFRLPKVEVPEGASSASHLRRLAEEGLAARLGPAPEPALRSRHEERLAYELGVIEAMDFPDYFLVVRDYVNFAKNNGILVGPGRGSAAGSLVLWALGITEIDPIAYGLFFERFLNPGRKSMPDIDIDFDQVRRDEVLAHLRQKHGNDRVAQIGTFGKFMAKGVIRDVGRVLGMSHEEVDKIASLVPQQCMISIDGALRMEPRLEELAANDLQVARLLEIARSLEGLKRHAATHACGVLVSPEAFSNIVPLYRGSKGESITQFDMEDIQELGLVKFDLLGLITLTVIQNAERLIRARQPAGRQPFSVSGAPLDDPETFKLFADGRTEGVFQFESSGMRDLVVKMRPDKFDDLIALNALYRPGPIEAGILALFLDRRQGKQEIQYRHPVLKEVLEQTYGLPIYQEQVMQIAVELAGYTPSEADDLRKAMGKKKADVMAVQCEMFVQGAATKHKVPAALAAEIFNEIEWLAGYGFNKSHSVAYALIAYQTAWLKTHYPLEFMTALIAGESPNTDRIARYVAECFEIGARSCHADDNSDHGAAPGFDRRLN